MPFQSEKQRRYLWANEPEIAREWTDRYGAAHGGITRLGFRRGNPHSDGQSSSTSSSNDRSHDRGGDRHRHVSTPTRSRIQNERNEAHRRAEQRKEIARQEAERQDHVKRSLLSRITGGVGNFIRGAGNIISPMTLLAGGANVMGQEGIARMLASLNLGKGAVGLNKYNNQGIKNFNNLGLYTDRMNEEYEDEGRIGDYWREGIETVNTDISPQQKPFRLNEVFDDRTLMAGPIGNYAQQAVANQVLGQSYGTLDPFQQQQVDDAINTYGTTSLGTLRG